MIGRLRAAAGALAIGLLVAACGSGPASGPAGSAQDGTTAITVGTSPTLSNAALYRAHGAGYFTERKLAATLSPVQSGAAAVPLLLNGQLQFTAADPVAAIVAVSRNVPITIVAPGNVASGDPALDATAILVKGDGPVQSARDLAGRTVAVNALNGLSHISTLRTVDQDGGTSSAVRFVELPLPQMVDAVARGQVDAAVVNEPFATEGKEAGLRKIASPFAVALPGVPQLVYIAAKPYAAQNPQVVQAFSEAIMEANGYLATHPDEVRTIGRTSTQTPPEQLDKIMLPTYTAEPVDRDVLAALMELMVRYGALPAPVDVDDLLMAGP